MPTNKLGWRLGLQAYSFHHYTLFETIDKNVSLGLKYIEMYPTQVLNPERRDVKIDHNSSDELLDVVRAKLHSAGVMLVNYGCVVLPNDETESRKVFDFAKKMGIETLVSEPRLDALDFLDRLCQEYKINLAIHNHPIPSIYWNPDTVVKACEGRSRYVGACADTGHWVRSGIDPVEALKQLEGRIISLHIKDVGKLARDSEDAPWGTGVGNVKGLLYEIHRQGIKPVFSIEYDEFSVPDIMPGLVQSVAFFNKICDELAAL